MLQGIAILPAIVAAAILRTDRRLVQTLRSASALSAAGAIVLAPRNTLHRWRLSRLSQVGAVHVGTTPGSVYLDESGWRAYRAKRRRRLLLVVFILGSIIALAWYLSRLPQ